jgi:hypothetical protein
MIARLVDVLVLLLLAATVATQVPELRNQFSSPTTLAQWVVPWSALLYGIAAIVAFVGFIRRARWTPAAVGVWAVGTLLAATFASRAYGGAPWTGVLATGASVLVVNLLVLAWARRRTRVHSNSR